VPHIYWIPVNAELNSAIKSLEAGDFLLNMVKKNAHISIRHNKWRDRHFSQEGYYHFPGGMSTNIFKK